MTKICSHCGKGNARAGGYSNRVRATKYNPTGMRVQKANLQWSRTEAGKRVLMCTRCIKKGKSLVKTA